jgi:hypothetical protein
MPKTTAAVVTALALLCLAAPAYGRATAPRMTARAALPTASGAKQIVNALWAERERTLTARAIRAVPGYAVASAKSHDVVYLANVLLGDTPQLVPHPIVDVIPQIPDGADQPVFFAQVLTTNGSIDRFVWYLVAVERVQGGSWKIGFVTFGGRDAKTPPLRPLTRSDASTPRVTADARARITRMARSYAKPYPTQRTPNGVVVHSHGAVRIASERVYGLALPSGDALSCFTWHTIATVTYPAGVLQQRSPVYAWGHMLALGDYRKITLDKAVAQCTAGRGDGRHKPFLLLQDALRTQAISGVRAQAAA